MDRQPGDAVVLLDQNQPGGQRDVNQALHEQRQPRAEAEQQHDARREQQRAEQMVKRRQQRVRQQRLVGELVLERRGDAGIVRVRIKFYFHVNHRAAGVFHAGHGVNQRFLDGCIGAKFFDAGQDGSHRQPAAQHEEGERAFKVAAAAVFAGAVRFFFYQFVHAEIYLN